MDEEEQNLQPIEEEYYDQNSDLSSVPPENIGGIYELFSKVMKNPDVTRIANLSKEELGTLKFDVRGSLYVSQLAYSFGHKKFGDFFMNQATIILETSLSKEGYLVSTFVTSKRYATSTNGSKEKSSEEPKKKKPWDSWGKGK